MIGFQINYFDLYTHVFISVKLEREYHTCVYSSKVSFTSNVDGGKFFRPVSYQAQKLFSLHSPLPFWTAPDTSIHSNLLLATPTVDELIAAIELNILN